VVIFSACLDLEQKISFMDRHYLDYLCVQPETIKGVYVNQL